MSIQFDKERKTYQVRWTETNSITGEKIKKAKRGFLTKKEARKFEDEMNDINNYLSFFQLSNLYIDSLKGYANDETIASKKSIIQKYCTSLLPLNVRNITKQNMVDFKNEIYDSGRSLVYKNKIIRLVKAISKYGSEFYDYPNFAISLKAFPKTSDDVKEINIISVADFNLIVENIDNEVYKRFIIFLYHTGMRRGEAMALLKSDINGKYASLNKSVRLRKNGFTPLKNASSKRTILLDDIAYDSILPLLETEGEYVFGEYAPIPASSIARHFNNALKKTGLPHYRIHDLRHSFISNAILNGNDIVSVSKYVGHSDIERTLNTYSHLLKDSEKRLIDNMNNLYKNNQ